MELSVIAIEGNDLQALGAPATNASHSGRYYRELFLKVAGVMEVGGLGLEVLIDSAGGLRNPGLCGQSPQEWP